ncbi:MAG: YifB family Mg chelatase-like AAA ATPase [Lachnospiraceae bacterium]|nr:YifB family Mg chelatase-like AAA ATPase [Lachnospiraceae bacterium]
MFSKIYSATLSGIESRVVSVEADVSDGLPVFEMVGALSVEVKEGKERVRTVIRSLGQRLPARRITVNFSPADLRKRGTGFDLPVALAVLSALGNFQGVEIGDLFVAGELGLSGEVLPIRGILPMLLAAKEAGLKRCLIPMDNMKEASFVPGLVLVGIRHIREAGDYLTKGRIPVQEVEESWEAVERSAVDFADVHGQENIRRACEIAAAGMHNLLMYGPPGAGKSLVAGALPSILSPMTDQEKTEVMKIYSVSGKGNIQLVLDGQRPFRSPHHTITEIAMAGGGVSPRPGEITLAHRGVLFLDELPEFDRKTLEILRQPLEEHCIHISRNKTEDMYPAEFLLVAAMNPCKCGYYPSVKCHCSQHSIQQYISRISQPLLDRFDLCAEAKKVKITELKNTRKEEDSGAIRERVVRAMERQRQRYERSGCLFNSQVPSGKIIEYCELGPEENEYLDRIYEAKELTVRGYYRILRVARTIADLAGSSRVETSHLMEAVYYRTLDRRFWEVSEDVSF